ncbi:hypothetical protein JCM6882_004409 [Rhodosporidiobolus microsporus]
MPPTERLTRFSLDHSFRIVAEWDLEFNIMDQNLELEPDAKDTPFKGAWTASLYHEDDEFNIAFRHGLNADDIVFANAVAIHLALFWIGADGTTHLVHSTEYDPAPLPQRKSAPEEHEVWGGYSLTVAKKTLKRVAADVSCGTYLPGTHRSYRFVVTLEQGVSTLATPALDEQAETLATRTSGLTLEQLPHDVRLFFPHAHTEKAAELWAKSDFLSRSSPYFKDLLASDFAESKPCRSKRARTSGAVEAEAVQGGEEKDYPDSDDETDTLLFSKRPPKLDQSSEADEISYRQISITQTAFSTYQAILIYLQTGFIHFTPLSSSFSPSADSPSRNDFLSKSLTDKPSLPLPVSPKSAYRLAHLLQLDDLQKRSLDALRSSLSAANAASELFSPTSIAYDELRKVVLAFVKENWKEVQKSEGWKEAKEAVKADKAAPGAATVFVEVLEAVAET